LAGGFRERVRRDIPRTCLLQGSIKYVEPSKELKDALAADPKHAAEVYAAHGIWYDALEEISNQIVADPKNRELLAQRAALLDQAGLSKVTALHGK